MLQFFIVQDRQDTKDRIPDFDFITRVQGFVCEGHLGVQKLR